MIWNVPLELYLKHLIDLENDGMYLEMKVLVRASRMLTKISSASGLPTLRLPTFRIHLSFLVTSSCELCEWIHLFDLKMAI